MKRPYGEPEYRRRIREETENNKRQAERVEGDTERDKQVEKLIVSISEIKHQLEQGAADDKSYRKGERRRHLWEIAMLATAAAVGLIAILVSSYDSHEQRTVMADQVSAMRAQIAIMEDDSAARRSELMAIVELKLLINMHAGLAWAITPRWTNLGKTNAVGAKGWGQLKVFIPPKGYDTFDFLEPPSGFDGGAEGTIITPGSSLMSQTKIVTSEEAWDYVYGRSTPVMWGYWVYSDIFNRKVTVRYCYLMHFIVDGSNIVITGPVQLKPECNSRIESKNQ